MAEVKKNEGNPFEVLEATLAGVRITDLAAIGHRPDTYYFMVITEGGRVAWAELEGDNDQKARTWAAACAAWAAIRARAQVTVTMHYRRYTENGDWRVFEGVSRIQLS
ncbi:hypothetical protein J8F10_37370 [Gemmata sp. G18]|uniref:Uncharacterized protein n=1 Tax=Gemmata palustris TaxID=2822762 RepID=A0ABS5C4I8_9BACT|nr:hypothetical protein [Gemmata palustris]MBP3960926.1 hypothetical protein [Gemmata palustris]